MNIRELNLPGVFVIEPKVFTDTRGYFFESWSCERYAHLGLPKSFVQDNVSRSIRGVVRGLHIQNPNSQGRLISVLAGEVFDVAVDVRVGSPTFGKWIGQILSDERKNQIWIPPGFAHGFMVTSHRAVLSYKCTEYYSPEHEFSIAWDDPEIAIQWPVQMLEGVDVEMSAKDLAAKRLRDIDPSRLPALAR